MGFDLNVLWRLESCIKRILLCLTQSHYVHVEVQLSE